MLLRSLVLLLALIAPLLGLAGIARLTAPPSGAVTTPQDRNFIMLFLEASVAAAEAGTLAAQQATDPGLRAYGGFLRHTLGDTGRELGTLVAPLHLPPLTDAPDAEHKGLVLRLQHADPARFDHLFLEAQLQRQQDLLRVLSIEVATGDHPALRRFAQRQLPVVQDLQQRALALRGRPLQSAAVP